MVTRIESFYKRPRVLEIGSYDVNGSVRSNFKNASNYVGVDLIPGPSVDVVNKGHLYKSETKFDIVLSVESFEHNSDWIKTFENMIELADDNGIVIFTCATKGRLEHGTYRTDPYSSPGTASKENSYYKNLTATDFMNSFPLKSAFVCYDFFVNDLTKDLYFYGLKGNNVIDSQLIKSYFSTATSAAISVRKDTSRLNYLKLRLFYLTLSPLYTFFSDELYQNITYLPYKTLRRFLKKIKTYINDED